MNSVVFGQYYNSNSWIHRLDPRTKLLSLILFMVAMFFVNELTTLVVLFAFVIILLLTSKVPFGKFLSSLKSIIFILMFSVVFQLLANTDGKLLTEMNFTLTVYNVIAIVILLIVFILLGKVIRKFRLLQFLIIVVFAFLLQAYFVLGKELVSYSIRIYEEAVINASFISLRIIILLLSSSLLTLTTKPTELNVGLESLLKPLKLIKVNVAVFSMMVSIALRYIPTLINEANKILKAQASRGVDFKESKFKDKINQIIALIVPMFIIAYKRASDLADAMEARGYDPDSERTSIRVLKYRCSDIVSLIFITLISIVLIVGSIVLGI